MEAFLRRADPDSFVRESRGKVDWRDEGTGCGGMLDEQSAVGLPTSSREGAVDDPTNVQPRHLFPKDIGQDLPGHHPPISVPDVDILEYLGGGQFGYVYAGKVRNTGLVVAMKVLRNDRGGRTPRIAANEALMGAKLRHRNIMRVFDLRPVGQFWMILMELVVGDSLSSTTIQSHEVKRVFGALSDAVFHMGQWKVVHRDLKPDNIIIRRTDRSPVIVDLGLSVDTNVFDPKNAGWAGTPVFMPPEAIDGVVTNAFDAYSLGVTAAKTLTGQHPDLPGGIPELFDYKKSGVFRQKLIELLDGMDETIASWISRLTENDMAARLAALNDGRAWHESFTEAGSEHDGLLPIRSPSKKPWWRFW